VQTALMNVRFEGNNGHDADVTRCLLVNHSGKFDGDGRRIEMRYTEGNGCPEGGLAILLMT
jgi:hypothetical protein